MQSLEFARIFAAFDNWSKSNEIEKQEKIGSFVVRVDVVGTLRICCVCNVFTW